MCGVLSALAGCRVVQETAQLPGRAVQAATSGGKSKPGPDPIELQQELMQFADAFSGHMISGIDQLRQGTNTIDLAESLKLKLNYATMILAAATGPNPVADVLDMTVMVSLSRTLVERQWIPGRYGDSARPILQSLETDETNIWRIAERFLKEQQQQELRTAIEQWGKAHLDLTIALQTRALGLAPEAQAPGTGAPAQPASVFNLLMIDPLAGLDPATRELEQTRLLGERVLFVAQRMPYLIRWQTQLLGLEMMRMPQVQQFLGDVGHLTTPAERFSRLAEQLPSLLASERKQIVAAFETNETKLVSLASEVRNALAAGEAMSTSLNTTIVSFDALMKRFGIGEPPTGPPDTNAPPFSILDYAHTADEISGMARQLDQLMKDLNQTMDSPALSKSVQELGRISVQAKTEARSVLNYAFLLAVALVLLIFVCALVWRRFARAPAANK
jgi:hypothetical protein